MDSSGQTSADVVRQEMWLQCYTTGIDQAAGEVVKRTLSRCSHPKTLLTQSLI